MTHQEITNLLQTEMVPALGCTGPTAYALAAACCRPYLTAASEQIRIYVSPASVWPRRVLAALASLLQ